jgi:hypothetical protein
LEVFTKEIGGLSGTPSDPLTFGKRADASGLYFHGAMDDIRIFNRSLTGPEIKELYDEGDSALASPTLIAVEQPTQNRRPVFKWFSVGGATDYTIHVDTARAFAFPLAVLSVSDTTFVPQANLPTSKIYWRVKCANSWKWSLVSSFTIQPDSVPFPMVYAGAVFSGQRPPFCWHPVSGTTTYRIEISDSDSFNAPFSVPLSDTVFIPLADLAEGTWYWRVSCERNFSLFSTLDSVVVATAEILDRTPARQECFDVTWLAGPEGKVNFLAELQKAGSFRLDVYNVAGRLLWSYPSFRNVGGNVRFAWENSRQNHGMHVVVFKQGNERRVKKMMLIQ